MKKIVFSLLILGVSTVSLGQNLDWAKQFVGSGNTFCRSIALDHSGNVFTTGSFDDTLIADMDTGYYPIGSKGRGDIYLSKRSATGALLWIHSFGNYENDAGLSVAVDSIGNVFITGYFADTIDFDPGVGVSNLISQKWYSGTFICKYDPSGNFLWARQIGSGGVYYITSMSASNNGTVYLFGKFSDTVDFDPGTGVSLLYSSKRDNMFVAKYNTSGHFRWAKNLESAGGNEPSMIYLDEMENVYIAGSFSDTTDFDPGQGKYELTPHSYREDIFIEKLDSSGNFLWVSQFGGPEEAIANDVTVDKNGNVYSTGSFSGRVDFDPGPDSSFLKTDSLRNTDAFVSKLNSSGQFVWAKKIGSFPYLEVGYSLVSDNMGNIYTTGVFSGTSKLQPGYDSSYVSAGILKWEDLYLNKLDAQGNFLWTRQIGGNSSDFSSDIAIDPNNHIYLTGHFHDDLDFDMRTSGYDLFSLVAWDGFIARLEPSSIGISEIQTASSVSIYPNPFEDFFSIDLGKKYESIEVTITDISGKTILQEYHLNVSNFRIHPTLNSGVYLVSVRTNSTTNQFFKVIRK